MARNKKPGKTAIQPELIYQLLRETAGKVDTVQTSVAALDKKVDLKFQETDFRLGAIEKLDAQQNGILQEHHDRSTQLKKDNELREKTIREEFDSKTTALDQRVVVLEAPRKWLRQTWVVLLAGAAVGEAFSKIFEVFRNWK